MIPMIMKKRGVCRCLFLFLLIVPCLLSGCGKKEAENDVPPAIDTPGPLVPTYPGEKTIGNELLTLDISNTAQGYMVAISSDDEKKKCLQIYSETGVIYKYFIDPGEIAVIPFTDGSSEYMIVCYQQVQGDQYATIFGEKITVELESIFYPFLYPNQYVNFSPDTEACRLAQSLLDEESTDLDALDAIYEYVINNIVYDEEKAQTVESVYLPNIDETLRTGLGICLDYAALMTAMLRARHIPCRLVTGYAGTIRHAWIDVYIQSRGWVEQAVSFDGETWNRMDPTFASAALGGNDEDFIHSYISDSNNYCMQYAH